MELEGTLPCALRNMLVLFTIHNTSAGHLVLCVIDDGMKNTVELIKPNLHMITKFHRMQLLGLLCVINCATKNRACYSMLWLMFHIGTFLSHLICVLKTAW